MVFFETTIPDLVKSFTTVSAVVLGPLDTSLISFQSHQDLFEFLTSVLDTFECCDNFVYRFVALCTSTILFLTY